MPMTKKKSLQSLQKKKNNNRTIITKPNERKKGMTTASSSSGSFISVGKFDQPSQTARIHTQVNGRFVSIIKTGGKLYCIDSTCYHAGNKQIRETHGGGGTNCLLFFFCF